MDEGLGVAGWRGDVIVLKVTRGVVVRKTADGLAHDEEGGGEGKRLKRNGREGGMDDEEKMAEVAKQLTCVTSSSSTYLAL